MKGELTRSEQLHIPARSDEASGRQRFFLSRRSRLAVLLTLEQYHESASEDGMDDPACKYFLPDDGDMSRSPQTIQSLHTRAIVAELLCADMANIHREAHNLTKTSRTMRRVTVYSAM